MPGEHLNLTEPLFSVLRGYASLSPLRLLSSLPGIHFEEAHDFFLNRLLLSPHFQAYPPSERYQVLFWKWVIGKLDALLDGQDAEIDDRLYNHLVDLIQSSSSDSATFGQLCHLFVEESRRAVCLNISRPCECNSSRVSHTHRERDDGTDDLDGEHHIG